MLVLPTLFLLAASSGLSIAGVSHRKSHSRAGRPQLAAAVVAPVAAAPADGLVVAAGARRMDAHSVEKRNASYAALGHGHVLHGARSARRRSSGKCKVKTSEVQLGVVTTASVSSPAQQASVPATTPTPSSSPSSTAPAPQKSKTSSSAAVVAPVETSATATSALPAATSNAPSAGSGGGGSKPAAWPTKTQAGAVPSATTTSAADPYLLSLSEALNNNDNPLFTSQKKGDLTFYAQGQTSCGSVYDDSSYTAAVSHLMYDSWPGAGVAANRNPICGPWAPGRLSLTNEVEVPSSSGTALIGGDGLLNCVVGELCHIPMTATISYRGKSVQVQIVDRCAGCKMEDIDVTSTVFEALTGNLGIGRVDGAEGELTWSFDRY